MPLPLQLRYLYDTVRTGKLFRPGLVTFFLACESALLLSSRPQASTVDTLDDLHLRRRQVSPEAEELSCTHHWTMPMMGTTTTTYQEACVGQALSTNKTSPYKML